MVALKGNSFCVSAKDALKLIFSNLGLVAAAGIIQDIVLFIGQWTITGGTVACCWIYLNAVASDPSLLPSSIRSVSGVTTSFPVFTFILIVIISYCIGAVFMEVFGQIIDTLLLCFCEDTEQVRVFCFALLPSRSILCAGACRRCFTDSSMQHEQKYAPTSLKSSLANSESNKVSPSSE
jgi:hypothetical protein